MTVPCFPGYCLMANHVHLLVVPAREESLAKAVGRTHFEYTQYLHRLHGRSGHLWQNRFYSCAVEEPWAALRYVERHPVRARMVQVAWRYRWSSAAVHCNLGPVPGWLDQGQWRRAWSAEAWRDRREPPALHAHGPAAGVGRVPEQGGARAGTAASAAAHRPTEEAVGRGKIGDCP